MRATTFAAAAISLATVATAVPLCAINCFTDVVTEHPPLDCTLPDMYHCFCSIPSLQQYFVQCAYSKCASDSDAAEAVGFGVELCAGLDLPITIDTGAPSKPTTAPPTEPTPTVAPPQTTDDVSPPEPTDSESPVEPTDAETSAETSTDAKVTSEPSGTASSEPSGTATSEPSGTAAPEVPGDGDDEEPPLTVNAAGANAVSGLLAVAGVAAAALF